MSEPIYIGLAAKLSGTTTKAIRHYENIGLIPQALRQGKYRVYTEQTITMIRFIKCAQTLGFKLKELEKIIQEYDGKFFPWDSVLDELHKKKNNLLIEIELMQDLYKKLDYFEHEIKTAKIECINKA